MYYIWQIYTPCVLHYSKMSLLKYVTFLRPTKKGSDFDSADAVGGLGGVLLHTPKVAMTTPSKAGIENISSCEEKQCKPY